MRFIPQLFFLSLIPISLLAQDVKNNSFIDSYGKKVLRMELVIPSNLKEAWELFTTEEGWEKWASPFVKIDFSINGKILSSYDSTKAPGDPGTITLPIISYLQNEMIILKVELNEGFSRKLQEEDADLQEVIQFIKIDEGKTKIVSSMIGWREGSEWDDTYKFFSRGNEWTYRQLMKLYDK